MKLLGFIVITIILVCVSFVSVEGSYNQPTCHMLVSDIQNDSSCRYDRIPALNLTVDCMSGTINWFRRLPFHPIIAEIILDYNCTNLTTGEMFSRAPYRKVVGSIDSDEVTVDLENSSCIFGACIFYNTNPCVFLNEQTVSCNSIPNIMSTVTVPVSLNATVKNENTTSIQISGSTGTFVQTFISLSQSIISIKSSPSRLGTTSSLPTDNTSAFEMDTIQSVIASVVILIVSLITLVAVSTLIIVMHRMSSRRTEKKSNTEDNYLEESDAIHMGYIEGVIGDIEIKSITGSIATVFEEISIKKPQNLEGKHKTFQKRATANEYVLTTNLLDVTTQLLDFSKNNSKVTYWDKSPSKSLKSSNSGKPTNIDDYFEYLKASSRTFEQSSNEESSDSACSSIILSGNNNNNNMDDDNATT